jgi:hypothetical protein
MLIFQNFTCIFDLFLLFLSLVYYCFQGIWLDIFVVFLFIAIFFFNNNLYLFVSIILKTLINIKIIL